MLSCSWTFLRLEGFFFRDIHKTQFEEGVWANWATEYKIGGGKIYSHTNTFGAKYTIRVTRWHSKYKILNYIMKHNFCLSDLLTKSNRTTSQSYKVEERTFGTPCKTNILTYLYYELYIVFIFVLEINLCISQLHLRPPPPHRATEEHLHALSVRGVGHLQILHCPGAGHSPTPGPFPRFWHARGFLSEYNYTEGFTGKKADWLICQGQE